MWVEDDLAREGITAEAGTPAATSSAAASSASLSFVHCARAASMASWLRRRSSVLAERCRPPTRRRRGGPAGTATAHRWRRRWRATDRHRHRGRRPGGGHGPGSVPAQHHALTRILDHLLCRRVEHGLDHGRLDQPPPRRGPAPRAASTVAKAACIPASGSQAPLTRDGRTVGEPGQPGHAGERFHRLGETRAVSPRAVEAEGRHPDHDEVRVEGVDAVPAEAELLHDPRGEILDQDIGRPNETFEHLASRSGRVRSKVTPRLPMFAAWKSGLHSHH